MPKKLYAYVGWVDECGAPHIYYTKKLIVAYTGLLRVEVKLRKRKRKAKRRAKAKLLRKWTQYYHLFWKNGCS